VTGSSVYVADYPFSTGLIHSDLSQPVNRLYQTVQRQVVASKGLQHLKYVKRWEGEVDFVELTRGKLVFEIRPYHVVDVDKEVVYVKAVMNGHEVAFSPSKFIDEAEASFASLGYRAIYENVEDDVGYNYLADGSLVLNHELFSYDLNSLKEQLKDLVDIPKELVTEYEIKCAEGSVVVNGKCAEKGGKGKKMNKGLVIGLSVAGGVLVGVAVFVGVVMMKRRRKEKKNQEFTMNLVDSPK
jgi:hypothetical protein